MKLKIYQQLNKIHSSLFILMYEYSSSASYKALVSSEK